MELRREVESGHLHHLRQDAAHQSQGGRRSPGEGHQNQAFRRAREFRRAESVWGAWGDERLQVHLAVAEGCNLALPRMAHRPGGRDRRWGVRAEWSLLGEE